MSGAESDPPVAVGEEYVLDITELGEEGDGIGHVDDFVVFVPEADLGDLVAVRIDDVEEGFAVASVIEEE